MPTYYTRLLQFSQQFRKFYDRQFAPLLKETRLSMREVHILLFLANNPDYDTARDISALRGLSKSQISQAVELLTEEGLLRRIPDQEDRRVVHLSITSQGKPLAAACQELQAHCGKQLLAGLTTEEKRQFRRFLETVLENGTHLEVSPCVNNK